MADRQYQVCENGIIHDVEECDYLGIISWRVNGKQHRENGPALEWFAGDDKGMMQWWKNGKLHREDGPAIIKPHGMYWFVNGKRHREDGPAEVSDYGCQGWYVNDVPHRVDGPAIIDHTGCWEWRYNGKLHREDGPAKYMPRRQVDWGVYYDITEWYINGVLQHRVEKLSQERR